MSVVNTAELYFGTSYTLLSFETEKKNILIQLKYTLLPKNNNMGLSIMYYLYKAFPVMIYVKKKRYFIPFLKVV